MSRKTRRRQAQAAEAQAQAAAVAESYRVNGQEFVTRSDFAPLGWGFDNYGLLPGVNEPGPYASSPDDRKYGRDEPFYQSDTDVSNARTLARYVTTVNCPAIGIGENLKNYVVGKGFSFSAGTKQKAAVPKGMVDAVQDVIDEFIDLNDFAGDLDRELFWRSRRDGEFFLGLYPKKSGITVCRVIEPEQVTDPGGPPWPDDLLNQLYRVGIDVGTNWEFGVHKADHDVLTVYGYHVEWSIGDNTYMPARAVEHHKANVDRNVCRGMTDFYPAWKWLQQQARVLENTGEGAAELAAISYIIQHVEGVTKEQTETMRRAAADRTMTVGSKTYYKEFRPPGSKLDVPKGQEYLPGPMGAERGQAFLQVVQGILRQVATRWAMSEGMISGDDSNNTMASSIVAGSRFHRYAIAAQHNFAMRCQRIFWRVLRNAYDAGRFLRFGFGPRAESWQKFQRLIEISIEPPDVDEKRTLEQTQERMLLNQAGAMSLKTWSDKSGLDFEQEQENRKLEPQEVPPVTPPGGQSGGQPGMPGQGPPGMPGARPPMPGMPSAQPPQPGLPSAAPPKPTSKSPFDQMADDADESAAAIKLIESLPSMIQKAVEGAVAKVIQTPAATLEEFAAPLVTESVGMLPLAFPGGEFAQGVGPSASPLKKSVVMAPIPEPMAGRIKELGLFLPAADVVKQELEPHVTVKYGLLTDDPHWVVELLRDEGPFLVTIGELSVFPADAEQAEDVLKLEVQSEVLHKLHQRLKAGIQNVESHPNYNPHITLAYMRPGSASRHAGRCNLTGMRFYVSELIFSDAEKQRTIVPLTGVIVAEARAAHQRLCTVLEQAACLTDALECYP